MSILLYLVLGSSLIFKVIRIHRIAILFVLGGQGNENEVIVTRFKKDYQATYIKVLIESTEKQRASRMNRIILIIPCCS